MFGLLKKIFMGLLIYLLINTVKNLVYKDLVIRKGYNNSFNNWIDKEDII